MKKSTLAPMLAAFSMVLLLPGCIMYSTGPTEVGVRTIKFSIFGNQGVEEEVYAPGTTHFFAPFLSDWHTFDTRLTTLEMTGHEMRGDRPGKDDLIFKTIDGNDINLDIVVSYRIDPSKAPMILQNVAGNDTELKENIIRTVTRSKPRDLFGELNTEDFYLADQRSAKAEEVAKALNEILGPYGVIVERVGTGDYRFNPEYQDAIEQRKIADQDAEKSKSATRAAEAEYLAKVESAKGEVGQMKAKADGEFERAKIEADAGFKRQEKIAEAIKAEGTAEAAAITRMNQALAAAGGDAVVKIAIIEALKGKRLVMLPMGGGFDVRTTDINSLLELYGISSLAGVHADTADSETTTEAPPEPTPQQ